jgi:type I restriction-modification system DNA methylase subunit
MNVTDLISKYEEDKAYYQSPRYNETQLRTDFLDPFFELLGWDITNKSGKSNNEREVLVEEALKADASSNTKKPDYTFRLFSERKFFLEAKKPSVKVESDNSPAKQTRRYGYTAKLKISLLSNFEHLAFYDCSEKVEKIDGVEKCRIRIYHYTEYAEKFEEIKQLVGRASIYDGTFEKEWADIETKLNQYGVDKLFLNQINEWRQLLGAEIFKIKPDIEEVELNDLVQGYLNSIIFLRVCEDRNIEEYQTLLKYANEKDFKALIDKFNDADKTYNSGLFTHEYKKEIIENSQSVFWNIITHLYYPESPYSFSVFASDILGNIYEIFIAQKLTIEGNEVILKDKPENADRDVVTTPVNIIQDILRESVLTYCNGKTDKEILSYKFADIACGSGAFLLETYQLVIDLLVDYYLKTDKNQLIQTSVNTYKLPFAIKKQVLENCIYGVDKDYNAVEAARFGLLLKLLEGENTASIKGNVPVLPDLSESIIFGNSLIAPHDKTKGKEDEINPYDFDKLKFDVIVGNPPYMSTEDMKNITPLELPIYKKRYNSAYKQFDKYFLFIERCIQLLKPNGYLGYIVPSKFTKVGAANKLRELLSENQYVNQIISFGANQVFKGKTTYTCLLIIQNKKQNTTKYYEVKDYTNWIVRDYKAEDYDTLKSESLTADTWTLVPKYLKNTYNNIVKQSTSLSDLIGEENIYNGIQTSANNIYIHKADKTDAKYTYFTIKGVQWQIETELTKPYYKTAKGVDNLNTYRPFSPNTFVIYPYKKVNGNIVFVELKELKKKFPKAYKFLEHNKPALANPKRDIKPEPETADEWYRYGRHQSLDKCDVPAKIIVGVLSQGNKYAIDYFGTLISSGGTAGYCMITMPEQSEYSIYYIQALLNSKYLEWFSSLYGEIFRGGFIARGTKVLKQLPIRKIDFKNGADKALHDKIAATQEALIETQGKIDAANGNKRKVVVLQRQFDALINTQENDLKQLFNLGDMDSSIPLIAETWN